MKTKRNSGNKASWDLFHPEYVAEVDAFTNFFGEAPKTRIKNGLELMYNAKREARTMNVVRTLHGGSKRGTEAATLLVCERLNWIMGRDERCLTEATDLERATMYAMEAWPLAIPGRPTDGKPISYWSKTTKGFLGNIPRALFRLHFAKCREDGLRESEATRLSREWADPIRIAKISAPPGVKFSTRTRREDLSLEEEDVQAMLAAAQSGDLALDEIELCLGRFIKRMEAINGARPLHLRMCPVIGIDWAKELLMVWAPRRGRPVDRLSFKGASAELRAVLAVHPGKKAPGTMQPTEPVMILFDPEKARQGTYAPMEMKTYRTLSAAPAAAAGIKNFTPYMHRRTVATANGADLMSLQNISLRLHHKGKGSRKVAVRYLQYTAKFSHKATQKMMLLMAQKRKRPEVQP